MAEAAGVQPAVDRWAQEAAIHDAAGDYAWLAERLPGTRVIEIGCGSGHASVAMLARGVELLVIEPLAACRQMLAERLAAAAIDGGRVRILDASADSLDSSAREALAAFAPDCIVCWLAGGSAEQLAQAGASAATDPVKAFREHIHRQLAELAAALPSVRAVHLADRTAFPWQIKDTARDTLVSYHRASGFKDLPFTISRDDALFRRLDVNRWSPELRRRGGASPVLGSLIARRSA